MTSWMAPCPAAPVQATVAVPGSKSQTNRALLLSALAAAQGQGRATLRGALRSRDTDLMIEALRTLGLQIDGVETELTVTGAIAPAAGARVDCGLAGTVLRFVPPVAALGAAAVTFDGDDAAKVRPITPLLDALAGLGVDIDGTGLPFVVRGAGTVRGGTVTIDASASSQFVSALLLAGAAFRDGLTVVHAGAGTAAVPSAPHVAMTVTMLRAAGVDVDDTQTNRWRVLPGPVAARDWVIEPDLSNAVPFLAAAVVTGGTVRLAGWPTPSIQPADAVIAALRLTGSVVRQTDSHLEVQGPAHYPGFDIDLNQIGELTPAVAALAALATPGSVSRLTGIAHLRGHETDRLAALRTELTRLGGRCEETDDGLVITATALHGGCWRAYADHRMATAGAIIGLRTPGVEVDDIATTAKTLPTFPQLWAELVGQGPAA